MYFVYVLKERTRMQPKKANKRAHSNTLFFFIFSNVTSWSYSGGKNTKKKDMSDAAQEYVIGPLTSFAKNSKMLVQKCTKPNYKEFSKAGIATLLGFAVLGFVGYFVKLVFIPINNVIIGS